MRKKPFDPPGRPCSQFGTRWSRESSLKDTRQAGTASHQPGRQSLKEGCREALGVVTRLSTKWRALTQGKRGKGCQDIDDNRRLALTGNLITKDGGAIWGLSRATGGKRPPLYSAAERTGCRSLLLWDWFLRAMDKKKRPRERCMPDIALTSSRF